MVSILQNSIECICDALRDLVPFVKFQKREKHPWRSISFCKVATLIKIKLLHGCFPRFIHYINGTKSCKSSHINLFLHLCTRKTNINCRKIRSSKSLSRKVNQTKYFAKKLPNSNSNLIKPT